MPAPYLVFRGVARNLFWGYKGFWGYKTVQQPFWRHFYPIKSLLGTDFFFGGGVHIPISTPVATPLLVFHLYTSCMSVLHLASDRVVVPLLPYGESVYSSWHYWGLHDSSWIRVLGLDFSALAELQDYTSAWILTYILSHIYLLCINIVYWVPTPNQQTLYAQNFNQIHLSRTLRSRSFWSICNFAHRIPRTSPYSHVLSIPIVLDRGRKASLQEINKIYL